VTVGWTQRINKKINCLLYLDNVCPLLKHRQWGPVLALRKVVAGRWNNLTPSYYLGRSNLNLLRWKIQQTVTVHTWTANSSWGRRDNSEGLIVSLGQVAGNRTGGQEGFDSPSQGATSCVPHITYRPVFLLTGRRYGDRRLIKWARFCGDGQLA